MAYFLRQEKRKNRVYLQMYETYWDKEKKQPRSRSVKAFGYVDALAGPAMPDPVRYYKDYVGNENRKRAALLADETRPRAFRDVQEIDVGHLFISSLLERLQVRETIDILASARQYRFDLYDLMAQLIYARVLHPCSKSKTAGAVFPRLYKGSAISEDQVYDGCSFIGRNYRKYIELFNHCYGRLFKRDFSKVFFDCTNYYFEIDMPHGDRQKGPSKENRKEPVIGQALLLDADLIPVGMQMYPGNESEKPYIRRTIEEMKSRYKVGGKTVQVADKGLNCARNIYAAVKEADDGYIFSKSVHGKGLGDAERQWLLLENDENKFTDYRDGRGDIAFRLKSCVGTFSYSFKETGSGTGAATTTTFTVRERRIVSFNPSLAEKQRAEIMRMVDKASNYTTYKKLAGEDLGDAAKYVTVISKDKGGKDVRPVMLLNQEKIEEDLKYAGYNLLVTSETRMTPLEVYETYHSLWKIEESFRITKSYLDARPVYVRKQETIYGHFLICYLCLFLLRILETKCFDHKLSSYDLVEFARDFRVVRKGDGTFINISQNQELNARVKRLTGLANLDALYLSESELDKMFKNCLLGLA